MASRRMLAKHDDDIETANFIASTNFLPFGRGIYTLDYMNVCEDGLALESALQRLTSTSTDVPRPMSSKQYYFDVTFSRTQGTRATEFRSTKCHANSGSSLWTARISQIECENEYVPDV